MQKVDYDGEKGFGNQKGIEGRKRFSQMSLAICEYLCKVVLYYHLILYNIVWVFCSSTERQDTHPSLLSPTCGRGSDTNKYTKYWFKG